MAAIVAIAFALLLKRNAEQIQILNKKISLRKIGSFTLISIAVFAGTFVFTRSNPVWQMVPGLDRLAKISAQDISTQTRLLSMKSSLEAVNPGRAGWGRALIGWGPDNFDVAYNKFYDPSTQKYEVTWLDRAHNKLLDVLVMNGVLGLIIYLFMWFYVFRYGFLRKKLGEEDSGKSLEYMNRQLPVLFIAVAYFVQNIFVFDQISTYIPFFALLGFVANEYNQKDSVSISYPIKKRAPTAVYMSLVGILAALLVW